MDLIHPPGDKTRNKNPNSQPGKYFSKETKSVELLFHQRTTSVPWTQRQLFGATEVKSLMKSRARSDRSPCKTRWVASKEPSLALRSSTGRTCNDWRQASMWSKTLWTDSSLGYSHEANVMAAAAKATRQPQYVSEQDKDKKRPMPQTSKREKLPDTD